MPNAHDVELENVVRQFVQHIQTITARRILSALGGDARGPVRPPGGARPPVRRKLRLSPSVLKARRLQGKYMGTLRGLKPADRDKVKAVAKDQGVAEALRLAATLARPG